MAKAHSPNLITVVSLMVLVGTEAFGLSLAAGWAVAGLFGLGNIAGYVLTVLFGLLGAYGLLVLWRSAMRVEAKEAAVATP